MSLRYASIFCAEYPMFRRYLREYKYFTNDMDYRNILITALMKEAFYWQLVVDACLDFGDLLSRRLRRKNQLRLYPNIYNANADLVLARLAQGQPAVRHR